MITAWIASLLATSALLSLAAWAGEGVLRIYGRPARWVWLAALAGTVLLPPAAKATGGVLPFELRRPAPSFDVGAVLEGAADREAAGAPVDAGRRAARSARIGRALLIVWAAASLIALAGYLTTWRRLHRRRRAWRVGRVSGADVFVSATDGPAVVGLLRPSIVVPEWLLTKPAAERRLVLLHEREHVRAGDPALLAAAPLVALAMPWNLPLWWQLRRLRLAVELDCDGRVLARGVAPAAYGRLLLDIAGRGGSRLAGAAAIAEPRTFLERRLLAMSSPIPRLRLPRALALTAAAAAFAIVACETALPTNLNAPEPPQAEGTVGADAPAGAVIVERSADGDPVVILDGVVASHDVLRLLDPDRIDRVEVVKGKAALARDERATAGIVEVTTKEHAARIGERRLIELKARESAAGTFSFSKLRASDDDYAASAKRIAEVKARAAADGGVKQKADGGEIHPRHGDPAAIGRARFEKASAEGRAASRTMAEQSSQAKTAGTFRFREVEPALEKAKLRRAMESADVWIDGERATKADLAGLETSDIAAIEVLAPGAAAALGVPAGRGLIRITTR